MTSTLTHLFLRPVSSASPSAPADAAGYLSRLASLGDELCELASSPGAASDEFSAALSLSVSRAQLAQHARATVYAEHALLRSGAGSAYAKELCLLAVERAPEATAALLASDTHLWAHFFRSSASTTWFTSGWDPVGGRHTRGSLALACFALSRRHSAWQHLRWRCRAQPSPIVAAARPAVFAELDAEASVEALGDVFGSAWWESEELRTSLRSGEVMQLCDARYFAKELEHLAMGHHGSGEARRMLLSLCASLPAPLLAQRLLPHLQPPQFLRTLSELCADGVLGRGVEWPSMAHARVAAALSRPGCAGAQRLAELCRASERKAGELLREAMEAEAADAGAMHDAVLRAARGSAAGRMGLLVHLWLTRLRLAALPPGHAEALLEQEGVSFTRVEVGRKRRRRGEAAPQWLCELDGCAGLALDENGVRDALGDAALEAWLRMAAVS